ncbi:DUF1253-domain-containing protein [Nadsonia fulvescens var. elongata DSM 6958]|uniref:U3 small nucleolar RNA-associated protein 25 n=1 Tax=Nadsonia fulvescens var. elongata DSM 6958 TaxID=857566 RepID=A0A1E3PR18_9ASCO|nr:DUF1253-domain-containing protein [Nadsonia fulvescens var. elongata DSM 6958]
MNRYPRSQGSASRGVSKHHQRSPVSSNSKSNSHDRSGPSKPNRTPNLSRHAVIQESENSEVEEDEEEEEEEETSSKQIGKPIEEGTEAYNALLVLLNSDHQKKKPLNRVKSSSKSNFSDANLTTNSDIIEGLVHTKEEEEDEDEEDEEDLDKMIKNNTVAVKEVDDTDIVDPFHWHFENPSTSVVSKNATSTAKWTSSRFTNELFGNGILSTPEDGSMVAKFLPNQKATLNQFKIKNRVFEPFQKFNGDRVTSTQDQLAAPLMSGLDVLLTNPDLTKQKEIRNLYCLHALDHIYKTRDKILKNNTKISAANLQANNNNAKLVEIGDEVRDQGFTRPKVLILLPTKNACYEVMNTIISLSGTDQQENKSRFKTAFFTDASPPETKPEDFRELFKGNTDDMFCLGVKFTRKSLKLYSSFYSSDLILASPLGLRLIVGNEGDKKRDFDFLSSIELTVVDQAHAMQMQSWENVEHIFKHLNLMPKESHGCDFSRVRPWYLEENARFLRQTIITTEFVSPEINSLFGKYCTNIGGKVKAKPIYPGVLTNFGVKIHQTFTRFSSPSPREDPDKRFKYFTTVVLPSLLRSDSYDGTLIFISSYMDFVRLRNYMDEQAMSFAAVCEYTSTPDVSRARTLFANGKKKIMLYTERFHHFRRYELRGVKNILMYSLPENPLFYREILKCAGISVLKESVHADMVRTKFVFSKWDALKLERIVGADKVAQLICQGDGEVFDFF